MAGSVNKAIIVGNLGRDPEVRRMQDGRPIATLRIATSESWKDRNSGERRERTEWHTVVIFNEGLAKVAEQYLRKGAKVYIEGQLQTRKWQDQAGNDRYSTEIVLQAFNGTMQMLSDRQADDSDGQRSAPSTNRSGNGNGRNAMSGSRSGAFSGGFDDEIPFAPEVR